jgi:hypothetical protein
LRKYFQSLAFKAAEFFLEKFMKFILKIRAKALKALHGIAYPCFKLMEFHLHFFLVKERTSLLQG